MATIARTADVDKTAVLGQNVKIGPNCIVMANVEIGDDCELQSNIIIYSGTKIGKRNRFFHGAAMGHEPQTLGLVNPESSLVIGDDNVFREYTTVHRGMPSAGGKTSIGNNCYFMVGSHIGHDCEVQDNVVLTNYCSISGHCKIEYRAWLSGYSATHQFTTVGRFTYAAGRSNIGADVPPFMKVSDTEVRGLNANGLKRAGISDESIAALNDAYRKLYRRKDKMSIKAAVAELRDQPDLDENVKYLLDSLDRKFQHRLGRYLETFR
ncbi:MAG: acyl-ACP--UDP-N-acetylglucosamine O-acyltransferase [Phycisphaerae bacterium]|nr:acyl-ACP--UDP-N-acetylglucosamine O-acyltransferase [Phycisphaerae bacterium]